MRRILLLLFMSLAVVLPTFGQQNTVNAAIDATELLVGEQTVLHTTVNCNAGARVKFEGKKGENLTPGVEIVEISRPDTLLLNNGKRWQITRNYTLTSFDSALYRLPAIEVEIDGQKVQSRGEIALKVNTIDVDVQHPDAIRPPKGPIDGVFEWNGLLFLYCLLAWLALAACIALLLRLSAPRKHNKVIVLPAPKPAHAVAIEAIGKLQSTTPGDAEAQQLYFSQLTDILHLPVDHSTNFRVDKPPQGKRCIQIRRYGHRRKGLSASFERESAQCPGGIQPWRRLSVQQRRAKCVEILFERRKTRKE